MGRRYNNPPIIEALCELRFEPSLPWDLAIPGLLYEKVQDDFPKRRQVRAFETSVSASPEGVEQQVRTADRMQFLREDERALIQVGPDLLAVNHLKPYPTWQEFLPLVQKGFSAYREAANPKAIRRIGLRYINRIEIPGPSVDMEDYFLFYPFVGPNLPQEHGPFIVGIQIPYEGARDVLRLQLANASAETPDVVPVMLDLDYFLTKPGEVPLAAISEWLEIAHNHVEEAFEACITDRLRQMFEEVRE
jgi:uncharacterized protein (TIGR04255 family)